MAQGILNAKAAKILSIFFQDPHREWYLREIGRQLGAQPGTFQHTIEHLVKDGMLISGRRGNLRLLKLNPQHPLYKDIKNIIFKTFGAEAQLQAMLGGLKGIDSAFIFGSFAKHTERSDSDIDLMIIGKLDQNELVRRIDKIEEKLGRDINFHVFTRAEIRKKLASHNEFIQRVFGEPKIMLKGTINELTKID